MVDGRVVVGSLMSCPSSVVGVYGRRRERAVRPRPDRQAADDDPGRAPPPRPGTAGAALSSCGSASRWRRRRRRVGTSSGGVAGRGRPGPQARPGRAVPPGVRAVHRAAARRGRAGRVAAVSPASWPAPTTWPRCSRTCPSWSCRAGSTGCRPMRRAARPRGTTARCCRPCGRSCWRPARGLGTAWTTLHLGFEAEAAALLGIPDTVTQLALVPVAYYTGDDFKAADRRPVTRSSTGTPGAAAPTDRTPRIVTGTAIQASTRN